MALETTSHAVARRRVDRWLLATVALVILAYRPVLQLSFVGDDFIILHLLRQAGGLQHPDAYFHVNFFGYYRPVAFLSYAFDWQLWHGQAIGFHLTSLLLHTANTVLVFLFARRLFGKLPAVAAVLLFGLHPSSHEAVFWMSSRFDLLATLLMLLGLLAIQAAGANRDSVQPVAPRRARAIALHGAAVLCFSLALLSKESAFAFPLIAVGYDAFIARRSGYSTLLRLLPLLVVVLLYSGIRVAAGGPELGQGLARFAKVALLGGGLAALVWLAFAGVDRFLGGLAEWRTRLIAAFALGLAALLAGSLTPATMTFVRPKLAFASFAGFYLLSPVITLGGSAPPGFDPNETIYWATGLIALAGIAALVAFVWRRDTGWAGSARPHNAQIAFLLVFVAAALLPVSSMTEGKRYLYVASIGVSLLAGYAVAQLRNGGRSVAIVLLAVVLAVSGWQIQLKARDWAWASDMTRATVQLVRRSDHDPCRARNLLFLTAPVNIRDVYCHFYDYTFEDPATGCMPEAVRTLVRVVGNDVHVTARWPGLSHVDGDVTVPSNWPFERPKTITIEATGDTARLVTAADLRHFDVLLWPPVNRRIITPIGTVRVVPVVRGQLVSGQRIDLELSDDFDVRAWRFLYYDDGLVRELAMTDSQSVPVLAQATGSRKD
jgi:hypothetical protein